MNAEMTVILTGVFAASSCALIGTFLILRRMAMMADAISHAILPGLVGAYFLANGPNLIAGILGAALAGVTTVVLVETLQRTGRVKSDAAIGIVFPALFALGTFLISRYFSNVHLDADAILFGEIAFAPFDRLIIGDTDYGSQPLIVLGFLTLLNATLIGLFYKELKLATFDSGLATALGFSPVLIHYGLMTTVSVTTVGAFAAVGAILVVALMIVPAATAYLLTNRLPVMILISVGVGIVSAIVGYYSAVAFDVSISGMMAVSAGIMFGCAALFSPEHGVVARSIRRRAQSISFAVDLLLMHLNHHASGAESRVSLERELNWSHDRLERVMTAGERTSVLRRSGAEVSLTERGRDAARNHVLAIEPGEPPRVDLAHPVTH